jgi:peptidoglycan hydrolase-like protein with peptidoglycan-binding domain
MCNKAAFENYPIESYSFFQDFIKAGDMDPVADYDEVKVLAKQAESEEEEHDVWDDDETIDSTKEVQEALVRLYGPEALPRYGVDGSMGKETTHAVRHFQEDWNKNHSNDRIKEDGIPGVVTCAKLETALELAQFTTTPF